MTSNQPNGDVSPKIRLNRFLAQCGLGSRRSCDELISSGHIYCNGVAVTELGCKVDPKADLVEYRGRRVRVLRGLEYFAYYKPREVMVTAQDPEGRTTVYQALAAAGQADMEYLRYVGRLDYQSEGLLLLTNDGDLLHALTHPRFQVKKVYHVKAERLLTATECQALVAGVESEGQTLRAGAVRQLSESDEERKQYWYELDLFEGKNRQIRRMFEALQIQVGRLRRVQYGGVKLGVALPGALRSLTEKEIASLKNTGFKQSTTR